MEKDKNKWIKNLGWKQKDEYSGIRWKSCIHIGRIYQGWNSIVSKWRD